MKTIAKLFTLAAAMAVLATSAAFADNQQQQQLLAIQRAQAERDSQQTTIAVSASGRGLGRRTVVAHPSATRFELRRNQHGQDYGTHVTVK